MAVVAGAVLYFDGGGSEAAITGIVGYGLGGGRSGS